MITIHNRQLAPPFFFLDRKKTTSGINISQQRKKIVEKYSQPHILRMKNKNDIRR